MKKTKRIIFAAIVSAALAACVLAGLLISPRSARAADLPQFGNYFTSVYESKEEAVAANVGLDNEIISEGAVLLKNEDDSLPLPAGSKISVLGKNADRLYRSSASITNALVGEGFGVNPVLRSFYADASRSGEGFRISGFSDGSMPSGKPTGETPASMYDETVISSFDEYNDAAVIVISRTGGEGTDIPRTMQCRDESATDVDNFLYWGDDAVPIKGARNKDDHYLQLDQNETDLIRLAEQHFDNIIVVLNTSSHFECGFLDDPGHYAYSPKIRSAIWIGDLQRVDPIAGIISGRVNPSGHLPDTYARDFKADPTWQNFGNQLVGEGNVYSNLAGNNRYKKHYVYYKEGIYFGYNYYETRGFTEGSAAYAASGSLGDLAINGTQTTEWDSWYDAHVVYPFGHGLSYTTFEKQLVSSEYDESTDEYRLEVKVTNTGDRAGKDVVMLFASAPYETGGIEKPHVRLAAFEKTDMLYPASEAGEDKLNAQDLVLTFSARDMASYDYDDANGNGFAGYELEAGEYTVYVSSDAHSWADESTPKATFTVAEDVRYETDEVTGEEIVNRFDDMSDELSEGLGEEYLSRNDWDGTFPTASVKIEAREWIADSLEEWYTVFPEDEGQPYYTDVMPTQGAVYATPIKLKELFGLDYDDEKWEDFLDQLTLAQMTEIVTKGSLQSGIDCEELGITKVPNADSPYGWANIAGMTGAGFAKDTVLAATFNRDLAFAKGAGMGEEALWGTGEAGSNIPGWYAPAVNLHRSPFGGRTGEYFSEDGLLTGELAANIVEGARSKGLFTYVKHFAVNNQESQRMGVFTWANEQCMREQYFVPYEICVKQGGSTGIMSSFNRMGATWAFGDYDLLTNVLRKEWGFVGSIVTDSLWDAAYLSADAMIRAGGSLALSNAATISYNVGSPTTVSLLRRATHDVLYLHANSMAVNEGDHPVTPKKIFAYPSQPLDIAIVGERYTADVAFAELNTKWYPDLVRENVKYSLAPGYRLPDGLRLTEDGIITGTPEYSINNYRFEIIASYDGEGVTSETFTLNVIDSSGAIVYDRAGDLGVFEPGEPIDLDIGGARIVLADPGETSPVTVYYSLKSGCALPEGLSLSSDGRLTGTPTGYCRDYTFTVTASAVGYYSQETEFTLSVLQKLTFGGGSLETGRFGESYIDSVAFASGADDVSYSLGAGSELPDGLRLTADGYIVGTPAETCDSVITVIASSPFAESVSAEFGLKVGLGISPFLSSALADGKVGEGYYANVDNTGGAASVSYAIKDGSALPEGLTLSVSGEISGAPTETGCWQFTVVASADGAISDEKQFTIYVYEPAGSVTVRVPDPDGAIGRAQEFGATLGIVGIALGAAGLAVGIAATVVAAVRGRRKK